MEFLLCVLMLLHASKSYLVCVYSSSIMEFCFLCHPILPPNSRDLVQDHSCESFLCCELW